MSFKNNFSILTDNSSENFLDNSSNSSNSSSDNSSNSSDDSFYSTISSESCDWVLAIPFIVKNNTLYVLSVLDKQFKEWTFISGKVENNESCNDAVIREVKEETKNCVEIQLTAWNHKIFTTEYNIRGKIRNFNVYMIDITNIDYTMLLHYQKNINGCFKKTKLNGKQFNENLDINFNDLKIFMKRNDLWVFMHQIFKNEYFKQYVTELITFQKK
jgi:hypothetical protein